MKEILRRSFYKNAYLLIIAAWLYTISFIFSNYSYYTTSPERVQKKLENYIKGSEEKFESFTSDSALFKTIVRDGYERKQALEYVDDNIGLFIYKRNDAGNFLLAFWNTHKILPPEKDLAKPDGKYFSVYQNGEFEFIKKTFYLNGRQVVAAAAIPIRWNYFIKDIYYLKEEFAGIKNIEDKYNIVKNDAQVYIRNGEGRVLFGLKEKKKVSEDNPGWVSLMFRVIAIMFVFVFMHMVSQEVIQKKGWAKGFLLLTASVAFLRLLSYKFAFPFNFRQFDLFDPFIYASNSLHPSLGDLLINMVLLFWLVSYFKFTAINYLDNLKNSKGTRGWLLTGISAVIIVAMAFTVAGVIRSLIIDSKISFDVVNFFSLDIYTLISFIILCFIILSFFHLSHFVLLFMSKAANVPVYVKYFFTAVAGLVYLTANLHNPAAISNLIVLVWLLAYMLIMEFRKDDIYVPILKSSFFLMWLMFFAASISALIIFQNRRVEMEQRKRMAEHIAQQTDPSGESIMSIGTANFNNDFLASSFNRLKGEITNKIIKDSLINDFSGFLNKYDIRIYTYGNDAQSLYNDDSVSYEVITNIIANQSKKTTIPDVYYYESNTEGFSFLYQKEIKDTSTNTLGYFFVIAKPKKYTTDALYPELFRQSKELSTDIDMSYAYAVYDRGTIINHFGDHNFVSRIPKQLYPKQDFIEKKNGDDNELWYNAGSNKLVIIVRSGSVFFASITLFAYLFGSFLFIIVLYQLVRYLIKARFRLKLIKSGFKFNIRRQIQGTIIFISVFSFFIIGIATISFYINRFGKTNRERLVKAIQIMANEIESQISTHAIFDDAVKIYDLGASSQLERSINEISEIHNVDVNFYDVNGNLKVSTQPYVYAKQVLSSMMEPVAFYQLHYNHDIQFIQEETVGRFSYLSVYIPVRDVSGEPYAYLNIPYLNTQKELHQEISNFLVTLISLNAFIFVIAGAIALLLTNRITNSFILIGSKMKDVNLGKANEEITWNTNDEIGALVNEYNKMVKKLEDSAQALAKSEREGAWREMARQVAHEIKNPLTPMKLSIQYLQRAIEEKNPDMQALSQNVASTLVEQIDQLAKIASDFSQFANIGNVKMEVFDVSDLLTSLINLYNTNDKLNISWIKLDQATLISADRSQINRLFTNLLQNAIEASMDKNIVNISIREVVDANKLLISIRDEGVGIPEEKRDKIFTPNFTTKTSGTGLGLAMCKGIVEKANGKIWFETIDGEGTTFNVLLPLVGLPA